MKEDWPWRQFEFKSYGKLKSFVMNALFVIGSLIIFAAVKWVPFGTWRIVVASIGLAIAAVGGYAAKAQVLGLRPFGESAWRKAKRTYEEKDRSSTPDR
ncbi:hypothetical protein D3C81_1270980 [compost metagenome]